MRMTRSMKREMDRPPLQLTIINTAAKLQEDKVRVKEERDLDREMEKAEQQVQLMEYDHFAEYSRPVPPPDQLPTKKRKLKAIIGAEGDDALEFEGPSTSKVKAVKTVGTEDWSRLCSDTLDDYDNLPVGVMGTGKGVCLPIYEFQSVWEKTVPTANSRNPIPWSQDPAVPPSSMKPKILSVVGSVSLGTKLDLKTVSDGCTNTEYDPTLFTSLVMRVRKPKATALVFASGKMVITGTKSEEECHEAARRFKNKIGKTGFRVSIQGLLIQNIAASVKLGFRIRIHLLAKDKMLTRQIGYECELFTGVCIPLVCPKVKVSLFRTGSMLIAGAKGFQEVCEAMRIIYPFAKMYAN